MLVLIQDVIDRSGLTDSSSDSSSFSTGVDAPVGAPWEIEAPLADHDNAEGQAWDAPGINADDSLQVPILTAESCCSALMQGLQLQQVCT